eukprot:CAMPEP_0178824268 /NCGR_PEP_ID=MMETSP0746-20121128/5587_1 /TAXON_ID=913974 /ORGANISM="Nitzschia punctata, Strain CCMP561" /LENGTH=217 /DNA_ID=CAMNT_0020485933 /DNA_START=30 /DNA_END=683 /DNA_ORIENTATION=+
MKLSSTPSTLFALTFAASTILTPAASATSLRTNGGEQHDEVHESDRRMVQETNGVFMYQVACNKCYSSQPVEGDGPTAGRAPSLQKCDPYDPRQRWYFDLALGTIENLGTHTCLTADGFCSTGTVGIDVTLAECQHKYAGLSPDQMWLASSPSIHKVCPNTHTIYNMDLFKNQDGNSTCDNVPDGGENKILTIYYAGSVASNQMIYLLPAVPGATFF